MHVPIRITQQDREVSTLHVAAPGVVLIGRHAECHVRLEADLVSRTHARLFLRDTSFIVEDVSSNGTQVAPDEVLHRTQRELEYGSLLGIGPFALTVGEARRAR